MASSSPNFRDDNKKYLQLDHHQDFLYMQGYSAALEKQVLRSQRIEGMMRDIGEDHLCLDVPARRRDRILGRKRKKTHIRYSRLIESICTFRGHYITNQCTIPQIYRTFALFDFTKRAG